MKSGHDSDYLLKGSGAWLCFVNCWQLGCYGKTVCFRVQHYAEAVFFRDCIVMKRFASVYGLRSWPAASVPWGGERWFFCLGATHLELSVLYNVLIL